MNRASDRIVVLDLGEVLASPPDLAAALARAADAPREPLEAAYWRHRRPHDEGQPAEAYWTAVLADVGIPSTRETVAALLEADTEAWTEIRDDAHQLLDDLGAAGTPVAVLSNMPAEIAVQVRRSGWAPAVRHWFFSGELGVAKPDPRIYAAATSSLGVAPGSIVFFDDRRENVDAASAAGWDARLWTSGEATSEILRSMGLATDARP